MFYGFAGEFVEFATEYSEADPIAVLATFLSRFGVEVGRSPFFWAREQQHARVNAVLVVQRNVIRVVSAYLRCRCSGNWNDCNGLFWLFMNNSLMVTTPFFNHDLTMRWHVCANHVGSQNPVC